MRNIAIISLTLLALASCLGDGNDTLVLNDATTKDDYISIPSDEHAKPNPQIVAPHGTIPNTIGIIKETNGYGYIAMSGIYDDAADRWIDLYGTLSAVGQNVWLSIDGKPKGVEAINLYGRPTYDESVMQDIILLINNSTSMSTVQSTITADIAKWCRSIQDRGVDVRIGYVGYDEGQYAINAAMDLCDANKMQEYLVQYSTGPSLCFGGANAVKLQDEAQSGLYSSGYFNESGVVALRFADQVFSFRNGSNRIYINMTDEYNQPGNSEEWSVEYLSPTNGLWSPSQGTVHTIYCSANDYQEVTYVVERPGRMSDYTGGISQRVDNSRELTSLMPLEVTSALQHNHLLRFGNINQYLDRKPHDVKITIATINGNVKVEKNMKMTFTQK